MAKQVLRPPATPPAKKATPRFRFRSWLVLVPLTICILFWIGRGLKPAFAWDDVLFFLRINNRERYTQLTVFMILIIALIIILKIVRNRGTGGRQ